MIPVVPILIAGAAAVTGLVTGQRRWTARGRALETALLTARQQAAERRLPAGFLSGLPGPVGGWLSQVMAAGAPVVESVELSQEGEFDTAAAGPGPPRWAPCTARQLVVTQRPGFLWDARIALRRGLALRVRDGYVAGEGVLEAALGGAVTILRARASAEIARAELMRFLAEAALYPTALLPSAGVRWVEGGQRSAIATLVDGNLRASVQFRFGASGMLESVYADARGRPSGKSVEILPWEGRWQQWQQRGPFLVPVEGEAAWITAEGRRPYWRGRITEIRHAPAG